MTTISIIGTAGRRDDADRLNYDSWLAMIECVQDKVSDFGLGNVKWVSGGAAWADHIAVELYLRDDTASDELELNLPCEFKDGRFVDNGERDFRVNPGGISNYYHRKFKEATGIDSLKQIDHAISCGAETNIGKGFFDRNAKVAKSEYLIACTFGVGGRPKDGGTLDTCKKYKGQNGWHLSLEDFLFYPLDLK